MSDLQKGLGTFFMENMKEWCGKIRIYLRGVTMEIICSCFFRCHYLSNCECLTEVVHPRP